MKEKKLFDAITDIRDEFVEEARVTRPQKRRWTWRHWTAAAVCAALIAGLAFAIPGGGQPQGSEQISDHPGTSTWDSVNSGKALLAVVYPQAYAFDDYDARHAVIDENPVDEAFLAAIGDFSYETAAKIFTDTGENMNYSPLSLYYALAIAASGAGGDTADELLALLGASNASELSAQCGNLYRRLYIDNAIGKLKIANSLWVDAEVNGEAINILNPFVQNAVESFYASTHQVDFADTAAGEAMAKWISGNTNSTLSPSFAVDPEQILAILNTVYFYDQWTDRFDKSKTAEDVFRLLDGGEVRCDFMNSRYTSAGFVRGDGFTRASLGLKNAGSMVFILPDEGVSPYELLSSPERMREAFEGGQAGNGEVVWQIPKFDFGSALDLADALKELGVNAAFEQDADFSGITDHMAFISRIRQETHIAIDENGVEASAFTEICYAGEAPPDGRVEMILNRPFIYGITAANGTLLFVGVCMNPAA